jgi:L-rhamnose isomerase/sugar isomerase
MKSDPSDRVFNALDTFRIEIPSWGFANTGTRFGKFVQPAAASTAEEKFADAAQVHSLTGVCPTIALHVRWDLPKGRDSAQEVIALADRYGVRPGSINPNLFESQIYKFGSFGNPDSNVREEALRHSILSIDIAKDVGSRDISFWFIDGSNAEIAPDQRMLIEYKPFEPAFYHTDIADWGMAMHFAKSAGPRAKVLVDTGHHYASQNIEQIVAWLLSEDMLGGFHFNDRRYADDDLTIGSIDPYQVFRIFHEILFFEWETERRPDIAYMIDQSHNLKGKIEAMIQTVAIAQELFSKAALVDHRQLAAAQKQCDLIRAESCLQDAFAIDVRPMIREWRKSKGLAEDPMQAFRSSGYLEKISRERAAKNASSVSSYA